VINGVVGAKTNPGLSISRLAAFIISSVLVDAHCAYQNKLRKHFGGVFAYAIACPRWA